MHTDAKSCRQSLFELNGNFRLCLCWKMYVSMELNALRVNMVVLREQSGQFFEHYISLGIQSGEYCTALVFKNHSLFDFQIS